MRRFRELSVLLAIMAGCGRVEPDAEKESKRTETVTASTKEFGLTVVLGGGDTPIPADYDGRGFSQVAVFRPSTAEWFVAGRAASTRFGGVYGFDVPVPADYLGQGRAQMAVYRPSTGQWIVDGSAPLGPFGASTDIPVPGDYLGNGRVQPAVFRPSTGMWYIAGVAAPLGPFGLPTDVPLALPAYYAGTNSSRAVPALYRPSTGEWFIAGRAAAIAVFGGPNDVPVPADFDHVGYVQLAVFRPSTAQWIVAGGQPRSFGAASVGTPDANGNLCFRGSAPGNGTTACSIEACVPGMFAFFDPITLRINVSGPVRGAFVDNFSVGDYVPATSYVKTIPRSGIDYFSRASARTFHGYVTTPPLSYTVDCGDARVPTPPYPEFPEWPFGSGWKIRPHRWSRASAAQECASLGMRLPTAAELTTAIANGLVDPAGNGSFGWLFTYAAQASFITSDQATPPRDRYGVVVNLQGTRNSTRQDTEVEGTEWLGAFCVH